MVCRLTEYMRRGVVYHFGAIQKFHRIDVASCCNNRSGTMGPSIVGVEEQLWDLRKVLVLWRFYMLDVNSLRWV